MIYQLVLLVIVILILLYLIFIENKKNQYESFVPMGANGRFLSKYNQISTTNQSDINMIDKDVIVEEMKCQQPKPKKQCEIQEEIQYSSPPNRCCPKYPKCGCQKQKVIIRETTKCPPCVCKTVDLSRYVLKSSIPPCPALPDMSQYILKSEIPPSPDMSKYVLKSSIPPCPQCPPCPPCPDCNCNNNTKNCPTPKLKCTQVLEESNNNNNNNNNDDDINNNNKYYTSEEIQEIIDDKINSFKDRLNNYCKNTQNYQCNNQTGSIPKPYDEYMLDDGLQNSYTFS